VYVSANPITKADAPHNTWCSSLNLTAAATVDLFFIFLSFLFHRLFHFAFIFLLFHFLAFSFIFFLPLPPFMFH